MTNGSSGGRLEPLSVIGDYRLVRCLGEGGMASVWLAEHQMLRKKFAVKLLLADNANDPEVRARFCREASVMGALDHPNVVSVSYGGVTSDGRLYLVMEALQGQSLRALLENVQRDTGQPLTAIRAVTLVRQACAGVAHAHEHGVIHRDLKPENLFVSQRQGTSEQLKVLDFGIARFHDHPEAASYKTQTGVVLGTPYYMSPEQARGEPEIDARTDVYSLAAITYELLSGVKPHRGDQYNAVIADIITREPLPLDGFALDIPPGLAEVVAQGMRRDRTLRYQSIAEFDRALANYSTRHAPTDSVAPVSKANSARLSITSAVPTRVVPPRTPASEGAIGAQRLERCRGGERPNQVTRKRSLMVAVAVGFAVTSLVGFSWKAFRHSEIGSTARRSPAIASTSKSTQPVLSKEEPPAFLEALPEVQRPVGPSTPAIPTATAMKPQLPLKAEPASRPPTIATPVSAISRQVGAPASATKTQPPAAPSADLELPVPSNPYGRSRDLM